ncbi:hypothetical protein JCM19233_4482 [Vibrio astriarenae]|nr:hypothetical protein JCM19233_4482 [Vibrio sp. C7]
MMGMISGTRGCLMMKFYMKGYSGTTHSTLWWPVAGAIACCKNGKISFI